MLLQWVTMTNPIVMAKKLLAGEDVMGFKLPDLKWNASKTGFKIEGWDELEKKWKTEFDEKKAALGKSFEDFKMSKKLEFNVTDIGSSIVEGMLGVKSGAEFGALTGKGVNEGLAKELGKFDLTAAGSAEAMARVEAYREKFATAGKGTFNKDDQIAAAKAQADAADKVISAAAAHQIIVAGTLVSLKTQIEGMRAANEAAAQTKALMDNDATRGIMTAAAITSMRVQGTAYKEMAARGPAALPVSERGEGLTDLLTRIAVAAEKQAEKDALEVEMTDMEL
jgi:hypothetical protein